MNTRRYRWTGMITLAVLVVLFGQCAEKKEPVVQQVRTKKIDSLMRHSEELLQQTPRIDTTRRASAPEHRPAEPNEPPRVLDMLPQVNVARWAGMTFQKLDRELGDLSMTTPPSIRYYGICDKILFRFSGSEPGGKLVEITCQLDKKYRMDQALPALGLVIIRERALVGKGYIESECANEGIVRVRSVPVASGDSLIRKVVVTYR